jgi:glutamyl/glutaminyl-tRNA synthetase
LAPAAPWLRGFGDLRAGAPEWLTAEAARDVLAAYRRLGAEAGVKPRELLMPLRLALTGCEHGPELHYVLAALDRHEALERVAAAVALAATAQSEEGAP